MSTTLDEQLISQKIHNYNYAPGIATYGVDGKTGEDGVSGNNIYYTDYYINNNDTTSHDLSGIAAQIVAGHLPLKNSTISISRPYANGDYFFDNFGTIFKLKNIDAMKSTSEMSNYQIYFDIVGTISIKDDGYVTYSGDRLIINSSTYNGFDIVSAEGLTDNINQNAVMNIISNTVDKNNRVQLLQLNSVDSNSLEDGTSLVYYDAGDNAFHLESNIPIVIDADLKINNDNVNKEYDNYSTILTSHDSITYFKSLCDKLTYKIEENNDGNYYMMIYAKDSNDTSIIPELICKGVYAKVYGENGAQMLINLDQSTNLTPQQIQDISLCTCCDGSPDIQNYFDIYPSGNYNDMYSYDISVNFKKSYDASNYIEIDSTKYYYKGKRTISYKQDNENISKEAYIYINKNTYFAIFDPYLLIPIASKDGTTSQYWPLYYWKDYVVYISDSWDSDTYTIDSDKREDFITADGSVKQRIVSYPAHLINKSTYLELGTYLYGPMIPTKSLDKTQYRSNIHMQSPISTQTYNKSGNYVYKFTYIAPTANELDDIYHDTSSGFGPYHHSRSTDFFSIRLYNKLYTNETAYNIIALRTYNLHYVNVHHYEFDNKTANRTYNRETVIDDYPQFIDGEEYVFSFSLYIGEDGARLSNCSLSGRLANNYTPTNNDAITTYSTKIPKEIGTAAKVSLMHNSEIFLSHE